MIEWIRSLISPVHCEAPVSSPTKPTVNEPPIIFDEEENPVLQEAAKKFPMRPPNFESLLQPLRMMTTIEPLEGLKVDFGLPISPRLQFSNTWLLPHGQPGSYELTLIYAGGNLSNQEPTEPSPLLMSRYSPTTGRQDVKLIGKAGASTELRLTGNFMSSEPRDSQVQVEADYLGQNCVAGVKIGVGLESLSYHYTQAMTRDLTIGFEVVNMTRPQPILGFSYAGKYIRGGSQFFLQYLTYSQTLTLGAVIKGNKNISFCSEFTLNRMTQETDFHAGFSVRFQKAKFQALVSSLAKITAVLQHALNPYSRLGLHGEMDLVKQDQRFGISFSFGGA